MLFPNELLFPERTFFRKGCSSSLAAECAEFGKKGLLLYGHSLEKSGHLASLSGLFDKADTVLVAHRGGEPELSDIDMVLDKARSFGAEWLAGIGGGSVLDLAKAAAGLFNASEKASYYQDGMPLKEKGIPFIAVPTTCGTGSEATMNAVITNPSRGNKLSIRDKSFLAKKVFLDPGLLSGIPDNILAYSSFDALVQAYESFTSKHSTWFSESLSVKAMEIIYTGLVPSIRARNEQSISDLLLASYLAGLAFSSSRLGVIHGLAHPLGAIYKEPHGLICAACFVPSIKLNKPYIGHKYGVLQRIFGGPPEETIQELLSSLGIVSPFRGRAIPEKTLIIKETLLSGSTAANPKPITEADVEQLIAELFYGPDACIGVV